MTADSSAALRFDVEMRYRPGMPPVGRPRDQPGEYLGSGDGTITGRGLDGTIRWDLNEQIGPDACQMFFAGVVRTQEGTTISFESMGFGQVTDPATAPTRWVVTAAARFVTDDARYAWLAALPLTWLGEFDMDTYEHRYRILRPAS
ncbi:MAG: hypothetical protein ACRDFZ_08115 [Candidatus Limnocylindria bacterium]